MTPKGIQNDSSQTRPASVGQAEGTPASHPLSEEEIRIRAYEIYLERRALPGDEIEDWLQAERELKETIHSK